MKISAIIELINHIFRLIFKHEQSEHDKKVQAARRDPVAYLDELGGVRDDKPEEDADRTER